MPLNNHEKIADDARIRALHFDQRGPNMQREIRVSIKEQTFKPDKPGRNL
jgi:hypothetical protein